MISLMILLDASNTDGVVIRVCCTGVDSDRLAVLDNIRNIVTMRKIELLIGNDSFLSTLSEGEREIMSILHGILYHIGIWSVHGQNWDESHGHNFDIRTYR